MKILTFKRLIGLAAIGGVAYAHQQRGGEWTVASVKDTLRHLWDQANAKIAPIKREMHETLDRAAHVAEDTGVRNGLSDDRSNPRSYTEYAKRKDDTSRH